MKKVIFSTVLNWIILGLDYCEEPRHEERADKRMRVYKDFGITLACPFFFTDPSKIISNHKL